ncbi:MAG: hypothetical protein ACK50A_15945 [Sphingobacteriaceae bacterium]
MRSIKHIAFLLLIFNCRAFSQITDTLKKPEPKKDKNALKFNLNDDGSHYFQATFLNQTWLRFNESNPGTTTFGKITPSTFDIGLRRTRIQLFGQINDRAFIYFQFGQNNFNNTFASAPTTVTNGTNTTYLYGNRKLAPFFHDALCEIKVSKKNQLKLGGGLTVMNGLSRFSQPSIGTIMTMDVPVFLQYSVDQIDQFDRRLAVYARGQVGKIDYRLYAANPFPIGSNGAAPPAIGKSATFVNVATYKGSNGPGISNQYGGYVAYNIFENEGHVTPYMTGTHLGSKKAWNIAVGGVYQKNATWYLSQNDLGSYVDTSYANMMHWSFETYLDMPLNKDKGSAISAFAGYYNMNYGYKYLRYNGSMNPSTASNASNLVQSTAYGNAYPMFGSGQNLYAQIGYLLPKKLLGETNGQLMPYASAQYADYAGLHNKAMVVYDAGVNWFIKGHQSKLTLNYENRPTFYLDTNKDPQRGIRKSSVVLQYQIFI